MKLSFLFRLYAITSISLLCCLETYAATLKITNKSNQKIVVDIRYFKRVVSRIISKTLDSFDLKPNEAKNYNSGFYPIDEIFWAEGGKIWKVKLGMPALHVGGYFIIKDNGKFDSSRLGDNQQAKV